MLQDPDFANALNKRYYELRNSFLSFSYLDSFVDSVRNLAKDAEIRHYAKWDILSQSVGAPEVDAQPASYEGQVTKFSNWIHIRMTWLDENMAGKSGTNFSDQQKDAFSFRLFPNPATEVVYLEASAEIQNIEIFNAKGQSMVHKSDLSVFSTKLVVFGFTPGIYLFRIKMEGKSLISSKLVIR